LANLDDKLASVFKPAQLFARLFAQLFAHLFAWLFARSSCPDED